MQIGLVLPNVTAMRAADGVRRCVQLAVSAERLGYDAVWLSDHVVAPVGVDLRYPFNGSPNALGWQSEVYDPLVLLSAIAQTTERVQIGVCALAVPYRHPLMTAKMLATADQLADGRVLLGAGAGWAEAEFTALGLSSEQYQRRGAVTDDYLRAIKEAWQNTGPSWYRGEFVRFSDVGTFPHPRRKPHIPIWAAGRGAAVLRRAVRLGDGLILPPSSPEQVRAAVAALQRRAQRDRRDPTELTVAAVSEVQLSPNAAAGDAVLAGDARQLATRLAAYEQAGLQQMIVRLAPPQPASWDATAEAVESFASQVLPAVQAGAAR
jgi:probable F420-dependent oxidoreductase